MNEGGDLLRARLRLEDTAVVQMHRRGHHSQKAHGRRVALASDGSHLSGGMIALMPTAADAQRLALPGGEKAAELHCTLFFLGDDGAAWTEDQRDELEALVRARASGMTPVKAKVFGVAHWNGNGDNPSWVWSVGDSPDANLAESSLQEARYAAVDALESTHDRPELPPQHNPWVPHICAAYDSDLTLVRTLEKRLGPVMFDRIRLSFGDDDRDIPLEAVGVGLTASGLRRDALPHEDGTDFAEHNRQWEGAVQSATNRMAGVYAGWRASIREQIRAGAGDPESLASLGLGPDDRAAEILGEAMVDLARRAGLALQRDAERQGVAVPEWTLPDDVVTAAVGGRRLLRSVARMTADLMATSAVQSAKRVVTGLFTRDAPPETIADEVDRVLAEQQDGILRSQIGTAMSTAQTAGRQAVLEAAPPARYYASEILDKNTCGPCRTVDGEQFGSLETAIKAYPVMGYKDCVGPRYGNSCRGMIVAQWQLEVDEDEETRTASAVEMHGNKGDPGYELLHGGAKIVPRDFLDQNQEMSLREDLYDGFAGTVSAPAEGPAAAGAPAVAPRKAARPTAATMRPSAEMIGEGTVPWHTVKNHSECGAGQWAVVKDADGSVVGCHESEADADKQLAALYASEGDAVVTTESLMKGKPNPGTKKDKRLKENQYAAEGDCPPGMMMDKATGECMEGEQMSAGTEALEVRGPAPEDINGENTAPWRGPLTVEGIETGDGREFDSGSLTWADLPLPLRWNKEDSHGGEPHTVAVNVGRIDRVWREDSGLIMGEGLLDLSDEDGQRVHGKIKGKFLRGVSVDVDSVKDADMELIWPTVDPEGADEPDPFAQLFASPEKVVFHKGRIRAATLVDIPAFAEAYIALLDQDGAVVAGGEPIGALRASYGIRTRTTSVEAPARPPADWFNNPDLSVPTGITVTPEGRVYGHAALWGTCHIGQAGLCVTPPQEDTHPYFMTGSVACEGGAMASVGQITVGTGHADVSLGHRAASAHYDNTGWAVADVTVGNDAHGIWVAGAVRPGADPGRVHELRASGQVSGDWRRIGGKLRLVGLLAVNVPGFPVPKLSTRYALGEQLALVAAGIPQLSEAWTEEDLDQWAYARIMGKLGNRVHQGR